MSVERLKKFNIGYGFPLHRPSYITKRHQLHRTTLLAIPVLGIALLGRNDIKDLPALGSRAILASTIVGLPIIFLLDIIATLVTQPLGRHLKKRARQERQAINTGEAL